LFKFKCILLAFFTVLLSSFALAVYPTSAGIMIDSKTVTVSYFGGQVTANYPVSLEVKIIRGLEIIPSAARTISINEVVTVYFPHKIINRANVTDNATWNILSIDNNWNYVFINDDNNDGLHQTAEVTTVNALQTLATNSTYNFFVKFMPLFADSIFSGVRIRTTANNVSKYIGFNERNYGGYAQLNVSDNIDATEVNRTGLNITALFEGYYTYATGLQQLVTINIQFRVTQNIDTGISYNIKLDDQGNAIFRKNDLPTGRYYVCVRQYLPGLDLGVNHVTYVSSENINLIQDQIITINISDSLDAQTFLEAYISKKTKLSPMTEIHGKYQIKGADSNADHKINVVDIVAWENQSKDNTADQRGDLNWTEKANYNGDGLISGPDFSVWNKNKGQYVPPPEKDQ